MEVEGDPIHGIEIDDGDSSTISHHSSFQIHDKPPWLLSLLSGFQMIIPYMIVIACIVVDFGPSLCIHANDSSNGYLLSAAFMTSSIATLLNLYIGSRLPIILIPTYTLIHKSIFLDGDHWICPSKAEIVAMGPENRSQLWQERLLEMQGVVLYFAAIKMFIGYTGMVGLIVKFASPLTIAAMVMVSGQTQMSAVLDSSSSTWYITASVVIMFVIYVYLLNFDLVIPWYTICNGWNYYRLKAFQIFPIFLTVGLACLVCDMIAYFGSVDAIEPAMPKGTRTEMPWFTMSYPFQWGSPKISKYSYAATISMFKTSLWTSVAEYYACATVCKQSPPPPKVTSRGLAVEGIASLISGLFGVGAGMSCAVGFTGLLAMTKVCSRRVILCAAMIMFAMSLFPKPIGLLYTIPRSVIVGVQVVFLAKYIITGMSILQYVDMKSHRNLLILLITFYMANVVPSAVLANYEKISTGYSVFDTTVLAFLTSGVAAAVTVAFAMDNILPAPKEGRGIAPWIRGEDTGRSFQATYTPPFCDFVFNPMNILSNPRGDSSN